MRQACPTLQPRAAILTSVPEPDALAIALSQNPRFKVLRSGKRFVVGGQNSARGKR